MVTGRRIRTRLHNERKPLCSISYSCSCSCCFDQLRWVPFCNAIGRRAGAGGKTTCKGSARRGFRRLCVCEKPLDDDAKSMRITLELSSKRKKDPKTRDKQMDSRKKCLDRFDKRNWRHLISYYNSSPCRHCYSLRALP